eukprot:scaffold23500_cov117-Isochrysis_galbana.AAC.4
MRGIRPQRAHRAFACTVNRRARSALQVGTLPGFCTCTTRSSSMRAGAWAKCRLGSAGSGRPGWTRRRRTPPRGGLQLRSSCWCTASASISSTVRLRERLRCRGSESRRCFNSIVVGGWCSLCSEERGVKRRADARLASCILSCAARVTCVSAWSSAPMISRE